MTKLNNFVKLMRNKKALLNCIFFTLLTQIAITMGFIKLFNATKITEQILNLYKSSFSFGVLIFLRFIISNLF